jgi:hypothetical protein
MLGAFRDGRRQTGPHYGALRIAPQDDQLGNQNHGIAAPTRQKGGGY